MNSEYIQVIMTNSTSEECNNEVEGSGGEETVRTLSSWTLSSRQPHRRTSGKREKEVEEFQAKHTNGRGTLPDDPNTGYGVDSFPIEVHDDVLSVRLAQYSALGQLTDHHHRHHGEDHTHQQTNVKVTKDTDHSRQEPDEEVGLVDVPHYLYEAQLGNMVT